MPASAVASPAFSVLGRIGGHLREERPEIDGASADAAGAPPRSGAMPASGAEPAPIAVVAAEIASIMSRSVSMSMVMEIISRACLITCRLAS